MRSKKTARKGSRIRKAENEWAWSGRYRVWDANRKIFLYPENWIEPEQRPSPVPRAALEEVVAFVCKLRRRKSARLLLAGKNRTGVLVATQILACDLGKDLYRIDLRTVISKYIGETEKNLGRIFDTAKEHAAILFFDEADTLFGKRTDVHDSHDRYAHIEVNYLLERMEAYGGVSILTTSSRSDIDEAFLRRFHFVVTVPSRRKARRKKPSR